VEATPPVPQKFAVSMKSNHSPLILALAHPEAWHNPSTQSAESIEGEENTDRSSREPHVVEQSIGEVAYHHFLTFIAHACWGSYKDGYSTILVVLSTIPRNVRIAFIKKESRINFVRFFD
jgi:hypothetical protein